jgi:molybdenum cofactor cytidylyltransferase
MASSIRAGVSACDGDVVITLCDQPHVTSAHLAALVATGAPIAATAYADTLGVPAFFAKRFRNELLALRGDRGAKAILAAHRSEVVAIALEAAADDLDVLPSGEIDR